MYHPISYLSYRHRNSMVHKLFNRENDIGENDIRYNVRPDVPAQLLETILPTALLKNVNKICTKMNGKLVSYGKFHAINNRVACCYEASNDVFLWKYPEYYGAPADCQSINTGHTCPLSRFDWGTDSCHVYTRDSSCNLHRTNVEVQKNWLLHEKVNEYDTHPHNPDLITITEGKGEVYDHDLRSDTKIPRLSSSRNGNAEIVRVFNIYWIANNPIKSYEFAAAGGNRELRIYDRRGSDRAVRRMHVPLEEGSQAPLLIQTHPPIFCYNYNGTSMIVNWGQHSVYFLGVEMAQPSKCFHDRSILKITNINFCGFRSEYMLLSARTFRHSVKTQTHYIFWDILNGKMIRRYITPDDHSAYLKVTAQGNAFTTGFDGEGLRMWQL